MKYVEVQWRTPLLKKCFILKLSSKEVWSEHLQFTRSIESEGQPLRKMPMYNGGIHRGTDFQITCVTRRVTNIMDNTHHFKEEKNRLYVYIYPYYRVSLKKKAVSGKGNERARNVRKNYF